MVDVLRRKSNDSVIELNSWKYEKQHYTLYQMSLDSNRSILLLSTPFFGQGQISYAGIAHCVKQMKDFL